MSHDVLDLFHFFFFFFFFFYSGIFCLNVGTFNYRKEVEIFHTLNTCKIWPTFEDLMIDHCLNWFRQIIFCLFLNTFRINKISFTKLRVFVSTITKKQNQKIYIS